MDLCSDFRLALQFLVLNLFSLHIAYNNWTILQLEWYNHLVIIFTYIIYFKTQHTPYTISYILMFDVFTLYPPHIPDILTVYSTFVAPCGHKVTMCFLIAVSLHPPQYTHSRTQYTANPIRPNDERLHLVKRALSNKQAYLSSLSCCCLWIMSSGYHC